MYSGIVARSNFSAPPRSRLPGIALRGDNISIALRVDGSVGVLLDFGRDTLIEKIEQFESGCVVARDVMLAEILEEGVVGTGGLVSSEISEGDVAASEEVVVGVGGQDVVVVLLGDQRVTGAGEFETNTLDNPFGLDVLVGDDAQLRLQRDAIIQFLEAVGVPLLGSALVVLDEVLNPVNSADTAVNFETLSPLGDSQYLIFLSTSDPYNLQRNPRRVGSHYNVSLV